MISQSITSNSLRVASLQRDYNLRIQLHRFLEGSLSLLTLLYSSLPLSPEWLLFLPAAMADDDISKDVTRKSIKLNKLKPNEYRLWVVQTEATFEVYKCLDIVLEKDPRPTPDDYNDEAMLLTFQRAVTFVGDSPCTCTGSTSQISRGSRSHQSHHCQGQCTCHLDPSQRRISQISWLRIHSSQCRVSKSTQGSKDSKERLH